MGKRTRIMADMASACLVGIECRFNGEAKTDTKLRRLFLSGEVTEFCPELLGDLGVPRPAMQIVGGGGEEVISGGAKVIDETGRERTDEMIKGAKKTLEMANEIKPEKIYLKSKSPSCGSAGVTTALLHESGFKLVEVE